MLITIKPFLRSCAIILPNIIDEIITMFTINPKTRHNSLFIYN